LTILYTQVHCLRDDQVLLMVRHKEPNLGLWVAPGGKIEPGESPYEGAVRELYEETGLVVGTMHLRGVVSAVAPEIAYSSLHFLYAVTDFRGTLAADEREGALCWWPVTETGRLPLPHANVLFLPHVIDGTRSFYQAKYVYTADWKIIQVVEHAEECS
jgi:ADP-ribose pyrophosphatase YjhB (NUDIX family)